MTYLFGLIALIVIAVFGTQWFLHANPARLARRGRHLIAVAVVVGAGFLVLRGQLHAAAALLAAALTLASGGLGSLRPGQRRKTPGTTSQVRTAHLAMTLDHDTGEMTGHVLQGKFSGQALADLGREDLLELLTGYLKDDAQSASVLEAYLDARHPGWRPAESEHEASGQQGSAAPADRLSIDDARRILGVGLHATADEIREAWRSQMSRNHPGRGGSDYIAAKINEAKDILLRAAN